VSRLGGISVLACALTLVGCAGSGTAVEEASGTAGRIAMLNSSDACGEHLAAHHKAQGDGGVAAITEEAHQFQELAERALTYRQKAVEVATRLRAKIDAGEPLSGGDLEILREGGADYLSMREVLWENALAHECWLEMDEPKRRRAGLSDKAHRTGIMLSLAAALVLYDNYVLAASIYEQDTKLRRILNRRDSGYGLSDLELTALKLSALSYENRERLARGVAYYRSQVEPGLRVVDSSEQAYLAQLISQSPSYSAQLRREIPAPLVTELAMMQTLSFDLMRRLSEEGIGIFSMLFGNTMGLVEVRKGLMYRKAHAHDDLVKTLRPGDILLEKTPFRLTDLVIPGFWGHAAIWVGTEEELRAMGIWDHPAIRPHHAAVRNSGRIVEALRAGVKLSTLDHFLNVDDLLVMRASEQDDKVQAARVIRAFRQLGKAYDFNFDVETTDRIVCSELVYQVYTEMTWPTSKALGRATISPDQVAQRALNGGPLTVVSFYRNGSKIGSEVDLRLAQVLGASSLTTWEIADQE